MVGNFALSIITILFASFYLFFSVQLPASRTDITLGPSGWPNLILGLMIVMGIILFIRTIREKSKPIEVDPADDIESEFAAEEVYKSKYLIILFAMFVYILALSYVGFVLVTPFMLIAIAVIIGVKKWIPIIITSVVGTICLTYVFPILLGIALPRGVSIFRDFSLLFY